MMIAGSTGFLGRYVVNALAKMGSHVIIPYRGVEDDTRALKVCGDLGQVVPVPYDPRDASSIDAHINNNGHTNLVINVIGKRYETKNYKFDDVHVGVASRIAEACAAGNIRLIHVSALGADLNSPSAFLRSKAKGEAAVRSICPSATIIRPGLIVGDEDYFFKKWSYVSKILPFVPLVNHGSAKRQPVYVNDVAQAIVHCAHLPALTHSTTYELVGPDVFTIKEMLDNMYAHTHRPNKTLALPTSIINMIASASEMLPFPFWTKDGVIYDGLDIVASGSAPGFEDMQFVNVTPIDDKLLASQLRGLRNPLHWSDAKIAVYNAESKRA